MKLVIAGASGFLGSAWRDALAREGHEVVRLVRGEASTSGESSWDPYAGTVDTDLVGSADVVANLAGAPLVHVPWTASYERTFAQSRIATTRTLAEAIVRSGATPAFVAQSGVAGYGERGDEVVTESTPVEGDSVLARVTRDWEAATAPAKDAGARVVVLRTSVVLDARGGALKSMLPAFKLGGGAMLGDGHQYWATISLVDWVRAATYLASDETASGVYNLSAPGTTTNAEFTKSLAAMLHRPALLKVPAPVIRKALGPPSSELLGSLRIEPDRLPAQGFVFEHPTMHDRLLSALGKRS